MAMGLQAEELLKAILERHSTLSKRLQQAGRYVVEHPNDMALETITEIARRADVQPSVFVRFSQAFGFSGFSEMQKVFQRALAERAPTYGERIRRIRDAAREVDPEAKTLLRQFCEMNQVSLENLASQTEDAAFQKAIALIAHSPRIHVLGQRRSHATAVYLAYALNRTGKQARVLAGAGGMLDDEMKTMLPGDVLVAVSIHPYSAEAIAAVDWASQNGIGVLAITDGPLSPLSAHATAVLTVKDADWHGFHSIVAQICLAQVLVIGVAARMIAEPQARERSLVESSGG